MALPFYLFLVAFTIGMDRVRGYGALSVSIPFACERITIYIFVYYLSNRVNAVEFILINAIRFVFSEYHHYQQRNSATIQCVHLFLDMPLKQISLEFFVGSESSYSHSMLHIHFIFAVYVSDLKFTLLSVGFLHGRYIHSRRDVFADLSLYYPNGTHCASQNNKTAIELIEPN